ncbi:hypothetical protein G7K_2050-t1 [Saitoella complicata NRRL Y-17804]|uniref:Uncharacterized protein n=1 Tax=Saitoella complicata (strain BCRC 22490 / CBS 7301 / JCM 7358 / NBRC 10748 / NRRL Y-17804) TaxID=698492 RepID=A0A0E9NDD2_SAICN|nr:hypothetical protein G7K_2050-t1 [Saitoella complicata NRRL Y-17804]
MSDKTRQNLLTANLTSTESISLRVAISSQRQRFVSISRTFDPSSIVQRIHFRPTKPNVSWRSYARHTIFLLELSRACLISSSLFLGCCGAEAGGRPLRHRVQLAHGHADSRFPALRYSRNFFCHRVVWRDVYESPHEQRKELGMLHIYTAPITHVEITPEREPNLPQPYRPKAATKHVTTQSPLLTKHAHTWTELLSKRNRRRTTLTPTLSHR